MKFLMSEMIGLELQIAKVAIGGVVDKLRSWGYLELRGYREWGYGFGRKIVADSLGADSTVVVGVGIGGVVKEADSPFFFLALTFGLGAASPIAQA
nr:hypothetical protein [Tanacetum cinerariifolium]